MDLMARFETSLKPEGFAKQCNAALDHDSRLNIASDAPLSIAYAEMKAQYYRHGTRFAGGYSVHSHVHVSIVTKTNGSSALAKTSNMSAHILLPFSSFVLLILP